MMEIREYNEEMRVEIEFLLPDKFDSETVKNNLGNGRWIIRAYNEGGHNSVDIDLVDIIDWVKENKPELLK